jgi:hypothetical protein
MTSPASEIAARFKSHPQLSAFLNYCERLPRRNAACALSSTDLQKRLDGLDAVTLRLLSEILNEMKSWHENNQLYADAAYWDLVADRINDEINSRP